MIHWCCISTVDHLKESWEWKSQSTGGKDPRTCTHHFCMYQTRTHTIQNTIQTTFIRSEDAKDVPNNKSIRWSMWTGTGLLTTYVLDLSGNCYPHAPHIPRSLRVFSRNTTPYAVLALFGVWKHTHKTKTKQNLWGFFVSWRVIPLTRLHFEIMRHLQFKKNLILTEGKDNYIKPFIDTR